MSTVPVQKSSAAMRYLFLFLLGLVVGIVGAVMAMRALDARKDHYPESVMHVMDAHADVLKANMEQNRCTATDTLPQLQALRMMANDIEPAFGDLREDARFARRRHCAGPYRRSMQGLSPGFPQLTNELCQ